MSLVVLVPVYRRPANVAPLVESFAAHGEGAKLLCIVNAEDEAERAALDAHGVWSLVLDAGSPVSYPHKINAGYRVARSRYAAAVLLAADDVRFTPGWREALGSAFAAGALVVGTRDGGVNRRVARGEHSVHSAVAASYIEGPGAVVGEPGVVLHEGYRHTFCDDELVQTARARRVFAMSEAELTHVHPYALRLGGASVPDDPVYAVAREAIPRDRALFRSRVPLWREERLRG